MPINWLDEARKKAQQLKDQQKAQEEQKEIAKQEEYSQKTQSFHKKVDLPLKEIENILSRAKSQGLLVDGPEEGYITQIQDKLGGADYFLGRARQVTVGYDGSDKQDHEGYTTSVHDVWGIGWKITVPSIRWAELKIRLFYNIKTEVPIITVSGFEKDIFPETFYQLEETIKNWLLYVYTRS